MPRQLTGLNATTLGKIPGAEEKIFAVLDDLLDAMLALALGHKFQTSKFDPDSGEVLTNVWDVAPDYKALAFLIENVIGKVPNRVELTGKDGGPVKVIPWMSYAEAERMGLRASLELPSGESDDSDESEPIDAEVTDVTPE